MSELSFEVDVLNDAGWPVEAGPLVRAAQTVLDLYGPDVDCALTVVVEDDTAVEALNRQFRGVNAPTDVLSFPADQPPVELDGEPRYLGDLVIAFPYAAAQAARESHALMDSLSLLVVHGTLHLLGYDHDDAASRAAMWAAQKAALIALGLNPDLVPALEYSAGDAH
ncbi:MAG: rRNA maturation RNase YbeY [Anaerolineae bacterium]|nr:rRNA maturation RNase YbeY [Anaerolineae bacterium]